MDDSGGEWLHERISVGLRLGFSNGPDLRAVVAQVIQVGAGAADKADRAGPAEGARGAVQDARWLHAVAWIKRTASCKV